MERGQVLNGRYELVEPIGRGGMGIAWTALDDGGLVVIKALRGAVDGSAEVALRRLQREAKILMRLDHPGIVRAHDLFIAGGEPFLVLELVEGRTIDRWLEDCTPSLDQRLRLFELLVVAVAYAHGEGVLHRDLKPSNVLVDGDGRPRVLDFGLARAVDSTRLTRTGAVMGTLTYMAPEQARGETVDERADVFSLGMILARLLDVRLPFVRSTPIETYQRLLAPEPIALDDWLPAEPRLLLECALAKQTARRCSRALDLLPEVAALRADVGLDQRLVASRAAPTREAPPHLRNVHRGDLDRAIEHLRTCRRHDRGSCLLMLSPSGLGRSWALTRAGGVLLRDGIVARSFPFMPGGQPHVIPALCLREVLGFGLDDDSLGADEATSFSVPDMSAGACTAAELVRTLVARAGGRPQAVLLDDIQFACRLDLEWLRELVGLAADAGLLVLLAGDLASPARESADDRHYEAFLTHIVTRSDVQVLRLGPLAADDLCAGLDGLGLPDAVLDSITRRAEGNPQTANELLRLWHETGSDEASTPTIELARQLRGRYRELDDETRRIVEVIAAEGRIAIADLQQRLEEPALVTRARVRDLEQRLAWVCCEGQHIRLTQPLLAAAITDG